MNKEDINKIHELIKSDNEHNKLLGFILGRSGGLSNIQLFELCYDGGFILDIGIHRNDEKIYHRIITINSINLYFWYGLKKVEINSKNKTINEFDICIENEYVGFCKFLNLVL